MTKEQYEKLKEYEGVLRNAVKNDYVHISGSEFSKIAEIYNEIFTPLRKSQMNCNTCRLTALKRLGKEYFAEEEKPKEGSKRGRPKKIKESTEE